MSTPIDSSFFGIQEKIVLTKNGVWLSNGEEITHRGTLRGFSKNIFRVPHGFEIRIGNEKKEVQVEDTLYFVQGLTGSPKEGYALTLNDGRNCPLDPKTLIYQAERLTCKVPHAQEDSLEEAKFLSAPYYELLKHLENQEKGFSITIQGIKIAL